MKKYTAGFVVFFVLFSNFSYSQNVKILKTISVQNSIDVAREHETIELSRKSLGVSKETKLSDLSIRIVGSNDLLTTQAIDENRDGIEDILLFQPVVKANGTAKFEVIVLKNPKSNEVFCYSKFVPERIDDYAWENNKVAFRTYGPTAQRLVEENQKGGTLSSGIDAWMKRVEYPVIDKWYDKFIDKTGTYHEDTGEGLDNFHVGDSRGIGGIAIKKDSVYYTSKNFISWKTIANGPIRTVFQLDYAVWNLDGKLITETKKISLDYGNFLYKDEVTIKGTTTVAVGLTLHKNTGTTDQNIKQGWMSYWEQSGDSELGTAVIVVNPILEYEKIEKSKNPDLLNSYLNVKVINDKLVYYAGFGWKKQGTFSDKNKWMDYLEQFTKKLKSPFVIKVR